jgi:hypothetical protein
MEDSGSLPNPLRDALQVERDSWCCLSTYADYAGSTRCFARCGDKIKKPSRNGVTACFDSWVTVAY